MVKFETSMGEIILELNDDKAPKTVANFMEYVTSGHY
ncbi:MAG: peptidylprolyl isomerase, partial [Promethearchaeota archaeon]